MKKVILSAAIAAVLAAPSATVLAGDTGFYAGASVGQTEVDYVLVTGATINDDSDTSWKIFVGYDLTENFAVEAAYRDFGENTATILGHQTKIEGDAFSVSLLGKLPVNDQFNLFAKLGYADVDAKATVSGIGSVGASDSDFIYGIGADYALTDSLVVRAEWEEISTVDEISTVSVGLGYRF